MDRVVVVGAGHAGFSVASAVREQDHAVDVTLIGQEPDLPYQRPPLSKEWLAEKTVPAVQLPFRPRSFYDEHRIELRLGMQATALDRSRQEVVLGTGERVPYDGLVLATGARPRRLRDLPRSVEGLHTLATKLDADRLRPGLTAGRRVVVVGGGFIGLEVAAAACIVGANVTVLEATDRLMSRVVSRATSTYFEALHRNAGVTVLLKAALAEVRVESGRVTGVVLSDGSSLDADLVVVGIGVQPRDELAREAGLLVEDGVVVNEHLVTSDPAISAVGDCARFPKASGGGSIRLESVQNATDQGRCVARRLGGRAEPYAAIPWFWTSQLGSKLQIAGLPGAAYDLVVQRGDRHGPTFSVFFFAGGRLATCESVNAPTDHVVARRLLQVGGLVDPRRVEDLGTPLRGLLEVVA